MPEQLVIGGLLCAGAAIGLLAVFGGRLLLPWYLREVRGMEILQTSEEAIITYPLA